MTKIYYYAEFEAIASMLWEDWDKKSQMCLVSISDNHRKSKKIDRMSPQFNSGGGSGWIIILSSRYLCDPESSGSIGTLSAPTDSTGTIKQVCWYKLRWFVFVLKSQTRWSQKNEPEDSVVSSLHWISKLRWPGTESVVFRRIVLSWIKSFLWYGSITCYPEND